MSPTNDERRYSEEEFALVLRLASEADTAPEVRTEQPSPQDGLTLSEMREIAAEVGIDPDRVSRAVGLLPAGEDSAGLKLLGGSPRHRLELSIPGVVPRAELSRVIEVFRKPVSAHGETREVLGGLEWTGNTGTASYGASVTPGPGETTLQAWTDRTETMFGILGGIGFGVGGGIALALAKLVFGETDAGIVTGLLCGLPSGYLVARGIWKRSTKKYREGLMRLLEAMTTEAQKAVERSKALEGGGDREGEVRGSGSGGGEDRRGGPAG
jgi:hypothetical protein